MTSRERITRALRREPVDRIPWTPLIDGYCLYGIEKGSNQVDVTRAFGGDVFARHIPVFGQEAAPGGLISIPLGSRKSNDSYQSSDHSETVKAPKGIKTTIIEKNRQITCIYDTPVGILKSGYIRTDSSPFIPFPTEHRIKYAQDLKILRYIIKNTKYYPAYEVFSAEDDYIGDDGIATTTGPSSPFHVLLESELGIEKMYYMLCDHRSEIIKTLDLMHEKNLEIYRLIADSPAKVVISYENTSTTTLSPMMFERYCLSHINDYAMIMKKHGKIFLSHMCGKLFGLEKQLDECMVDGIVDIAPPPTGDVTLGMAKKLWGHSKLLMGGIDATVFKGIANVDLKEHIKEILTDISPGDGMFIGSADATPLGTSMDTLKEITSVINEFGTYPIRRIN